MPKSSDKLKAEMWDRMQFLFRNYYDRMVHLKLVYDGKLDIAVLKQVIVYMVERAPVLHSSFNTTVLEPYWQREDYTVDDILTVTETDDAERDVAEFLSGVIPYENNVQIKIAVFEQQVDGGVRTALGLRVNHMCMDGGDLKYFIVRLVQNYNRLKRGDVGEIDVKAGSRSFDQVYSKFEGEDLKHARGLYKNIAKAKDHVAFPWSEAKGNETNRIVSREINEVTFKAMRAVAKNLGVTVNDALMAVTFRAMYEFCGLKDSDSLTVACATDLRKHIVEGGAQGGLTNHTAWLACRTLEKGATMQDTVVNVIRSMKGFKRDKFSGLYSLPLLKLAYTILPQDLAEFAIKMGYDNPLLAVSNMGQLDDKGMTFDGLTLKGGFVSGATKYKPFFLMSVTTLLGRMTLSTAIRGTDEDVAIANKYFDLIEKYLQEFLAIGIA